MHCTSLCFDETTDYLCTLPSYPQPGAVSSIQGCISTYLKDQDQENAEGMQRSRAASLHASHPKEWKDSGPYFNNYTLFGPAVQILGFLEAEDNTAVGDRAPEVASPQDAPA